MITDEGLSPLLLEKGEARKGGIPISTLLCSYEIKERQCIGVVTIHEARGVCK